MKIKPSWIYALVLTILLSSCATVEVPEKFENRSEQFKDGYLEARRTCLSLNGLEDKSLDTKYDLGFKLGCLRNEAIEDHIQQVQEWKRNI